MFVVPTRRGTFEIRESHATPQGPRSRTLSSFRELSAEVVEKALARATKPVGREQVRELAIRAGAPLAAAPVDKAACETLRLVAAGRRPDPVARRLLVDALLRLESGEPPPGGAAGVSDAARAASAWVGASAAERGRALRDLLLLADALPAGHRNQAIQFPRLRST